MFTKTLQKTELYSSKYNYLCIYVAKSGCSSFRRLFLEIHKEELAEEPMDYHKLQNFFPLPPEVNKEKIWKLIVVRNPYSRIVSAFANRYIQCDWAIRESLIKSGYKPPEKDSFFNFLSKLLEVKNSGRLDELDIHVRRQTFGVEFEDPKLIVVNVEKFREQIPAAYSRMFGPNNFLTQKVQFLLKSHDIHENKTNYDKSCLKVLSNKVFAKEDLFPHFSKMYDEQTKFMVKEIYLDDFIKLRYPLSLKQCMFV